MDVWACDLCGECRPSLMVRVVEGEPKYVCIVCARSEGFIDR